MNDTLELSEYTTRKADLERARALAETDVQSATFKTSTGSGTPEGVHTAKNHLAAIQGQQSELEALWEGTQADAARQYDAGRDREYSVFLSAIEAELAKRELAVEAVASATEANVKAVAQYRAATQAIRDLTARMHRNAGASVQNAILQLNMALEQRIAEETMSALLNSARIGVITAATVLEAFGGKSPVEYEGKTAGRVRSAVQQFAPRKIGDA